MTVPEDPVASEPRGGGAGEQDGLAEEFAAIARHLHSEGGPERVYPRITRAATITVPGCDHAAISLIDRHGTIHTVAPTDEVPVQVDALQHAAGHGPCLDAIADHETYLIDDVGTDVRWPRLSRRIAADTGVRSMLAFRLYAEQGSIGALNLYSRRPGVFTAFSRGVGAVLASHAATAIIAARAQQQADELQTALHSSRSIGIALGILMARRGITEQDAFDLLRRASQDLNRKLRDLAVEVVETGAVPGPGR